MKQSNFHKIVAAPIIIVLLFALSNCKNSVSTPPNSTNPVIYPIDIEILLKGSHSNFTQRTEIVLKNEGELQKLMSTINSTRKPGIEIPEIDFEEFEVGFVCPGQLSSGGHSVEIRLVEKKNDSVIVRLGGTSPGEIATTVITSPFILFKFEKQDLPVRFKWPYEK